ncbi:MAG: glycoside hydrolase family 2 [Ruminococcaceae bacterium]|nr:glycoside hydrolase family 2 [Oscillospiraceae bacterium]
MAKSKNPRLCQLETPFETDTALSWQSEHPRPQLKRDSWQNLCGQWQLSVKTANSTEQSLGEIAVPYPPESRISGIMRPLAEDETYIYTKIFSLESFKDKKILLHFGAVDQQCKVFVNEIFAGEHTGGYLPFTFDITEYAVMGQNTLRVEVTDKLDIDLAYGKQTKKRGGMWYTPISGIWQAVWLETVAPNYIKEMRLTPSLHSITIETDGGCDEKTVVITTPQGKITHSFNGSKTTVNIPNPQLWSPESPYLYSFTLTSGNDKIESYFALRTITIKKVNGQSYICLNGKPYFFHGLLDQGYYSDGIYTPATPNGYVYDILTMKKLGFNMLRKHIKIEPDLFYYYCDKYGMVVFQDMLNAGTYHYIIDTVLPTIGFKRGFTHPANAKRKEAFERECRLTCDLLYNHPCVCYYTIFNEGWGQYDADRIYTELKEYEPTRIWDATSGWFFEKKSDVDSHHIYFRKIKLKAKAQRPLVLSEFGGYSFKETRHSFNLDDNYGYKNFDSRDSLTDGIVNMYMTDIVNCIKNGMCATVYTQVSDVEDETNGLVTYDRQVIKVNEEKMQDMAKALFKTFEETTK